MRINSEALTPYRELLNWEKPLQELLTILFGSCDSVYADAGEYVPTKPHTLFAFKSGEQEILLAFEDLKQPTAVLTMMFAERLHYQRLVGKPDKNWGGYQPIDPILALRPSALQQDRANWKAFQVSAAGYSGHCWLQSDVNFTDVQETKMENQANENSDNVQLSLSLGEVELSIGDLLRLRPGMVIKFERPTRFEAALEVGGAAWGEALIELSPDSIELKVTKTAISDRIAPNLKNSTQQIEGDQRTV